MHLFIVIWRLRASADVLYFQAYSQLTDSLTESHDLLLRNHGGLSAIYTAYVVRNTTFLRVTFACHMISTEFIATQRYIIIEALGIEIKQNSRPMIIAGRVC